MLSVDPTVLLILATALMLVTLALAFIPILPGPLMPWAVGIVYGLVTGWTRITPAAAVVMTLLMIVGITADYWRPLLGAKTTGMGCRTSLGSFAGGIIGTFLIPIPLVGTVIGLVAGALVMEFIQFRDLAKAMSAGRSALKQFALGYALTIGLSIAIFAVYVVSVFTTG
ncbi:MAG: DUF456 family protein [Anaerolineaceae bacterium]|nr:DUF456 family protein [Anaerolineaceae bacterium]